MTPIQGLGRDLHVMAIRGCHDHGQRRAALIGQGVALCAAFPSIRRIRACRRPPNGALTITLSSDCQRHWIPRISSYRSRSTAHSFSKTPVCTQAWNRRWQVNWNRILAGEPSTDTRCGGHKGPRRPLGGTARPVGRECPKVFQGGAGVGARTIDRRGDANSCGDVAASSAPLSCPTSAAMRVRTLIMRSIL